MVWYDIFFYFVWISCPQLNGFAWSNLEIVLMLCQCCSAIIKHWCDINTLLATNVEHNAVWAAVRKVNSISSRPNTPIWTSCDVVPCHSLGFCLCHTEQSSMLPFLSLWRAAATFRPPLILPCSGLNTHARTSATSNSSSLDSSPSCCSSKLLVQFIVGQVAWLIIMADNYGIMFLVKL